MISANIRVDHLRLALLARRTRIGRWCAYSTHPATGGDCTNHKPWRAHGGPLPSPWFAGDIAKLAEQTHRQHGAREVRRTWGIGVRALCAERRA